MTRNSWIGIGVGAAAIVGLVVLVYLAATMPVRDAATNNAVINNAPIINVPVNDPVNEPVVTEKSNLIRVFEPLQNQLVTSPMTVRGEARGNWYFEASFPIKLVDANGQVLVQTFTMAQGEWMTTDFVPFQETITFPTPTTATGFLILEKDNPSGLPEFDDSISIPVTFTTAQPAVSGGCVVSGCSSEICADEEMVSACIYKEEFACYKTAACERQTNGQCGWTETAELTSCIDKARK